MKKAKHEGDGASIAAQERIIFWLTETKTAKRYRGVTAETLWRWAPEWMNERLFSSALRELKRTRGSSHARTACGGPAV